MNRRDFLRKSSITTGVATAATAGLASANEWRKNSVDHLKEASDLAREGLNQRVEVLEKKVEKMDGSQKKTIRVLVVLTGLSLGLDLSLLV